MMNIFQCSIIFDDEKIDNKSQYNKMKAWIIMAMLVIVNSTTCDELVDEWLEDPEKLPPISYADSGKFLNDLGDYNNCLYHDDQFVYVTMRLINVLVGFQYMGFCAPKECKEELTDGQFATKVEDFLNQLYQNQTGAHNKIFVRTTFYVPDEADPPMDWTNYTVLGLLVVILLLGVVGSIVPRLVQSNSLPVRALKCFSFYDNFGKIVEVGSSHENENLLFLNGMRVISIYWIVFGHGMWFTIMNIKNWMETAEIMQTPGLPTLAPAAYFAVDTFFWIGGFLVTIGLLSQVQKAKNVFFFWGGSVLHRFIRIWPTYMLIILIFWKLSPYLGNGPIWNTFFVLTNSCNNGGVLWNMFFIDNFGDHGTGIDYCFGWGWYLAVDFQLFIITPFIIYAYHKNKKLGWIITFVLFLASIICAFVLIMVNDWRYPIPNPKMKPQPEFMDDFYYKPYVRASAYFMGIFSGYVYYQWKNEEETTLRLVNKIKKSIPIRILFYLVGIALCELVIWIIVPYQRGEYWSTVAQAFYNSLNRVFFLIGVYLCVFAAMFGCKNDPTKFILGHRIFSPLAKVSFCIYLVHFVVIMNGVFGTRMDMYWEPYSAAYTTITYMFWATLFAVCLSLMVEAPTLGLQKLFLRGDKKDKKKDKEMVKSSSVSEELNRRSLMSTISADQIKEPLYHPSQA